MGVTKPDRRLHPRYLAPYRVVVSAAEAALLSALTDDISSGGLFLATNRRLPLDQNLEFTLHLPDGKRAIRCRGQIVRRAQHDAEGRNGYGVQLDFADPDQAIDYVRRLDALREGRVDISPLCYRLLLVDDFAEFCRLVADSLPRYWRRRYPNGPNLKVDTAGSGEQALELIKTRSYHLVVCDIYMPNLDGKGLLRVLRSDPALAGLPFLAISANDISDELMALDADAFMTKPFLVGDLFQTVHMLLAGRGADEDQTS